MRGIMVSGGYCCVRAGKITRALPFPHEMVARSYPPQFPYAYEKAHLAYMGTQQDLVDLVAKAKGDIIHVHNEPNWPVVVLKEAGEKRPIILNVHDVTTARTDHPLDPWEKPAYEMADALIFVSEEQRQFVIDHVTDISAKPYACIGNFADRSFLITRQIIPHIGGICYAGGAEPRGEAAAWRDLSPVADALDGQLHMYPGNPGVDYGVNHGTIFDYEHMPYFLARHDWGFTGTPKIVPAWEHSLPNKVFEYLAAGIPIIGFNNPLIRPLCEEGLGIYLERLSDIKHVPKPIPFRKRVLANRHRFTMEYNIQPVVDLYNQLG